MNAKLTAKETALMTAIAENFFSFFDGGLVAHDSGIWTDSMTAEIVSTSRYDVSKTQRGAASVINSLGRKGLLTTGTSEDGAWTELTEAGEKWITDHNWPDEAEAAPAAAEEAPAAKPAKKAKATKAAKPAAASIMADITANSPDLQKANAEADAKKAKAKKAKAAKAADKLAAAPAAEEPAKPAKPAKLTISDEEALGDYKPGDRILTADGRDWTIIAEAKGKDGVREWKISREEDGKTKTTRRFARNIEHAK